MLSASDSVFAYRARAGRDWPGLRHVSLEVPRGSRVGILGANGSGKTTLLRLLGGTTAPDAGTVTLEGRDIREYSRRSLARMVAAVPQETHLAFDYSVLEIVLMGRHAHLGAFQVEGPRDIGIARDALEATGTSAFAHRSFATLSGGEKQRVVIAGALAQQPSLMLLDEPTASLDIGYQLEIAALLRRLNVELGITMVVATHDLNFAASVCDRLVLLRQGEVIDAGPVERVLTPSRIADLYRVEADVAYHEGAGHLTVIPLRRAAGPAGTEGRR